ncbi:MAG: hypothetical protein HDR83_03295 [Bacteroides sp.]|nr:hypothetical protein [Bacteroidales bacterium]MBD5250770.1 hypothetical protein [Barnesiella sp.]MBD5253969.1 hypothetical protein [Barnesiella sp.]MBD5368277.1 hypothetical protein [Bacteroides sp.]
MLRNICTIIMILAGLTVAAARHDALPSDTDELLKIIDSESQRIDRFSASLQMKADSISNGLDTIHDRRERLQSLLRLGDLYKNIVSDSALSVYRRGFEEAKFDSDSTMVQKFLIRTAMQNHSLGLDLESVQILDHVYASGLTPDNLLDYHQAAFSVNTSLYEMYPQSGRRQEYRKRAISHARKVNELSANSASDTSLISIAPAFLARENGNIAEMVALLNDIMDSASMSDPKYSLASSMLGRHYSEIGNHDEAVRIYARGTIADIRNANFNGDTQILLAKELYDRGDITRSYDYLINALDRAIRVGSKTNQTAISTELKPVAVDFRHLEERRLLLLAIMAGVLVIALVVILKTLLSLRSDMHSLKEMKQRLSDANAAKETYISQYLSLCSTFLERLEGFAKTCRRKITAGQIEDLLSFVKSGKTIDEQRREFYDIFDDTFIHIYPTFVSEVNALMYPDKRIAVSGNTLTTELRILAFQRLGIDDAAKVARFLGLSLNTIYTYRNKIRSRAVNRDTFDSDVMNIGIIS